MYTLAARALELNTATRPAMPAMIAIPPAHISTKLLCIVGRFRRARVMLRKRRIVALKRDLWEWGLACVADTAASAGDTSARGTY